jgi:hypothetical protein
MRAYRHHVLHVGMQSCNHEITMPQGTKLPSVDSSGVGTPTEAHAAEGVAAAATSNIMLQSSHCYTPQGVVQSVQSVSSFLWWVE